MIADKGETVTCETVHEICDVGEDIHRYSSTKAEMFTAWRTDAPSEDGRPMRCRCVVCGLSLPGRCHSSGSVASTSRGTIGSVLSDRDRHYILWLDRLTQQSLLEPDPSAGSRQVTDGARD
jgi:hypothetical protein